MFGRLRCVRARYSTPSLVTPRNPRGVLLATTRPFLFLALLKKRGDYAPREHHRQYDNENRFQLKERVMT